MGKLRFTLTYVLFWLILAFSCLLAENFAIFTSNPMGGFSIDSLIVFSLFVIALLIAYYVLEHKKNKVTFDYVLLPILLIFGGLCIATIWWQGPRTFINPDDNFTVSISFSLGEKFSYSLQVVVWIGVLYGLLFTFSKYALARRWTRFCPFAYVCIILVMTVADVIMEFDSIVAIFTSTYTGPGLQFIIYNENVWAHLILVGLLSCIVLNVKKFRVFYYILMFYFYTIIIFTSCATAVFVGFFAIVFYTLFEILTNIKGGHLLRQMILLAAYLLGLGALAGAFALMIHYDVKAIVNFWSFITGQILNKDYVTLTSRTWIWESLIKLVTSEPRDFIFGLGYKTSNAIFTQFFIFTYNNGFAPRSAHNGFLELLLRHGLVGLSLYAIMLILFIKGIIKLLIKKQFRIAFFYGLCVAGLLAHGMAESTMFFTPNVGGTYMTLVFFIPVLNCNKSKYFEELNNDLQQLELEEIKVKNKDILYYISVVLIGFAISTATSFVIQTFYNYMVAVVIYIVILSISLVGLWLITPIAYFVNKGGVLLKDCFINFTFAPIKNNLIPILTSSFMGVIIGFTLQHLFALEMFIIMLISISVFVSYYIAFTFFNKKEVCSMNYMFDNLLLRRLKYVDSEAIDHE